MVTRCLCKDTPLFGCQRHTLIWVRSHTITNKSMLSVRILVVFTLLAAIAQSAPTLPAKDPDRKGVIAFEVGASTAKMAAENEALKTENEELKAMLKAKDDKSESVKGLEVHKNI